MGKRCGACQRNRPGPAGIVNVHTRTMGVINKALRRVAEGRNFKIGGIHMLKNINWKVRLKSGPFWLGVASAVIIEAVQLLLLIPAAIGIISDPTTKGVQDSKLAMSYDVPKKN